MWVYKSRGSLPKFDHAALISGFDFQLQASDGSFDAATNGFAYISGLCSLKQDLKRYEGVSVSEDIGLHWSGSWTAAHELAHNLGAFHDGDQDSKDCSWDLGHIMSYKGWGELSKFTFSSCSINLMKRFLNSDGAFCLHK